MYTLDSTIDVNFIIPPGSSVTQADYDVAVLRPVSGRSYTDSGLTTFTAPTATVQGLGKYNILLNEPGRYRFTLSIGTEGSYQEFSQIEIFVVDKTSFVSAQASSVQTALIFNVVVLP